MANIYDQNVKLQAIADAITNQSITITTGQDLLDALADIANAIQPAAANISYDNTNSGLQAVNVQQAVDENANNISTLNSSINALVSSDYVISFNSNYSTNVTSDIVKVGNHLIVSATFTCIATPSSAFAVITKTDSSPIALDKNYPTIAHSLSSSTVNSAYVTVESDGELSGLTNYPLTPNNWYNLMFVVKAV